jgi:DNA-binding NtrC family response regulator
MLEYAKPSERAQAPAVLPELIGDSPAISSLRAQVNNLLGRQGQGRRLPTFLLQGETGTGKGLLARAIHEASIRASKPLVDIDCASIPETLLEAELFGVERGAFTDARQTKVGLFQTASGGTILLDEVGLLPRSLQAKLLKVVEERGVRRLGSTRTEVVDLWVLAATNVDLAAAVGDGSFREDLYHRLAAVTLVLPPLRSRSGDVLLLAEHFLARNCADYSLPPKALAPDAQAAMLEYRWPGNVRELANRIERAVLLSGDDRMIGAARLALPTAPVVLEPLPGRSEPPRFRSLVKGFERERVVEALRATNGNITVAAGRLGLPRNTLRYRMDKLGIAAEEFAAARPLPGKILAKPGAWSPIADAVDTPGIPPHRDETRPVALLCAEVLDADDQTVHDDSVREFIAATVQSFGGRVEAANGARVVATFGVFPCEDPIGRAARTAMAICKAGAGLSSQGSGRPAVRIAVHASDALVRRTHSSFVMDEEHRRHAEGVLDAMLGSADAGAMLVSRSAARFLKGRFTFEPAPAAAGEPGGAFHLVGPHGRRRPFEKSGATPFVGRRLRLELLERLFERAEAGRGQVVGIVAEAGAGKSRLLHEFSQRLAGRQLPYRWVRFVPYGRGLVNLSVVEGLRQAWHIAHEDGRDAIADKVRLGLEALGMDADRWAPYLLTLFGVRVEGGDLASLGRKELRLRVFDALRRVAVETSKREPLIIEVEDLHLFGKAAGDFLSYLVENLAGARILLLTAYRPEYHPSWVGRSYCTQLTLPPLPRDESRALLGTLLPNGGSAERLTDAILAKAQGNPFFLEELARSAAGAGESEVDLPVPDTVRVVLEARMDRLEEGARRLLQAASVIGRRVPARLLELVCEEPGRLAERIAACKRLEFLHEEIVEGEPVYAFKDTLVWEVAQQRVSVGDRETLRRTAQLTE